MFNEKSHAVKEKPPPLGGGPLGLGDPDDLRLRKTESDVIIPRMMLEEAEKKCSEPFKIFLNCAKDSGLLVHFKCKQENNAKNDCMSQWMRNPEFVKEVTEKYLHARSHYRSTGVALIKYVRHKKLGASIC